MPVKKNKNKKKKKVIKNKNDNSEIKKEIRKAVKQIPNLIVEEAKLSQQKEAEKKYPAPKIIIPNYEQNKKTNMILLWFGVIIITAIVFIMWLFNVKSLFYDVINNPEKKEEEIWKDAKNDLNNIITDFEKTKERVIPKNENLNDTLKAGLEYIIKTTTVTTSATQHSTTSTNLITSSTDQKLMN